ncbi:MAG: hypothetical protein K2Z80_09970 [Xanthobacteraceae bacterium]|nr:hypothetical protein [Xanthobacteraceae bacterium]
MEEIILGDLDRLADLIRQLASECRAEIDQAERPTDAFPIHAILPFFLISPAHVSDWKTSVSAQVWERISQLTDRYAVLVTDDLEIQGSVYGLGHERLDEFRAGAPILRMMTLLSIRNALGKGGRRKDAIEPAIRAALEYEVFIRDAEIGAMLALKRDNQEFGPEMVRKGDGLPILAERAWVEGIPTKGAAADEGTPRFDRILALFENLRDEGEKRAVARVPTAMRPEDVFRAVTGQFRDTMWRENTHRQIVIDRACACVLALAKACAHATQVTQEKHVLSRGAREQQAAARKEGQDPFAPEPMVAAQHLLFSGGNFTALQLGYVAMMADIDPNLLSPVHALATPEFTLARLLGRAARGWEIELTARQANDLRSCLEESVAQAMYGDVRELIRRAALELKPLATWLRTIERTIVVGTGRSLGFDFVIQGDETPSA